MKEATETGGSALSTAVSLRLYFAAAAGPLWLAIAYAQIPFRDGFDVTEHAFSYLSIGPNGWIQIASFVLAGCLLMVGATALTDVVPGRKGKVAAGLLGAWGLAKIASGPFTVDPGFGYPPGAPSGMPEDLSTHAVLHGVAFSSSVILWTVLLLVLGSVFARRQERPWAIACRVVAVGLFLVPPLSFGPNGALAIYVGVTVGYIFFSAVLLRLSHLDGSGRAV